MAGKLIPSPVLVLTGLMILGLATSSQAQAVDPPSTGAAGSGQTYAPIGESGYKVPIPEFKMRSIIGDSPAKPETPQAPAPAISQPEEPKPSPRARPVPREIPQPQVPRLPFEPSEEPGQTKPSKPAAAREETGAAKEAPTPPLRTPVAPDVEPPLPVPKKEVLPKSGHIGSPPLLEAEPAKEALKTLPLERTQVDDMADPRLWIKLDSRREPEVIPPEIPAAKEAPALEELPAREPPALHEIPGLAPPTPAEKPQQELPVKELSPREMMQPPIELPLPKEAVPAEEPKPPVKEAIPSPLDREGLDSPEVRDYLRATAPILEELSLVMTRAPSLAVADYDPSEPNPPVFPKELLLKMDSMKRELRILDSKTFEIIPPPKFDQFHSLIRESITQTYQACDAILEYFAERNETSLQKVREHLSKARELIRETRSRT